MITAFAYKYFTVFSALRVYALWYTSRFKHLFFAVILALNSIPVAIDIVSYCIKIINLSNT